MAVSKHQFQLLSEMGIELWQPKTAATSAQPLPDKESNKESDKESGKKPEKKSGKRSEENPQRQAANKTKVQADKDQENITPPDFDRLKVHPLFHDIILSIGLSIGEVTAAQEYLDLGLLHWQFSPGQQLSLSDKLLTTPSIQVLAASGKLKRQLWQLLQEHSL
ncbi:hypothetical protein [Thalassomonas haliotis]|uniref:DNA polymerase III subunit psi n=1 Tax=Thalassomonas haliotis TaxID=485448 RepID=A0ABY7VH08_9GAMM|nr:hypothetical protein [Thalassomonas haliotis]WDE12856.1 DNA polymerase III subunit psi [Thalassomonas haliotis]